jgi:hypothetical protein
MKPSDVEIIIRKHYGMPPAIKKPSTQFVCYLCDEVTAHVATSMPVIYEAKLEEQNKKTQSFSIIDLVYPYCDVKHTISGTFPLQPYMQVLNTRKQALEWGRGMLAKNKKYLEKQIKFLETIQDDTADK